jgi:hypothetical protein
MFHRHIRLTRAVAALLPGSLLWVFASCVLICGWENAVSHGEPYFAPTVEITETTDAPACEDCPDASLLKATTTGRVSFALEPHPVGGLPSSILSVTSPTDAFTFAPDYSRRFSPAPPLKLLPALRI